MFVHFLGKVLLRGIPKVSFHKKTAPGFHCKACSQSIKKTELSPVVYNSIPDLMRVTEKSKQLATLE